MISSISLHRFKAFSELPQLEIKPLTVICGKNSCGKSSILQSILLLKQTLNSPMQGEALALEGKYLHISNLRELAYALPSEQSAKIAYSLNVKLKDETATIYLEFRNKKLLHGPENGPVLNIFKWIKDKKTILTLKYPKYYWPRTYGKNLPKLPPTWNSTSPHFYVEFNHFIPEHICQEGFWKKKDQDPLDKQVSIRTPLEFNARKLGVCLNKLRREIQNVRYLGPARAVPQRAYLQYSSSVYELDEDGANAAYIFWLFRNEEVYWLGNKIILTEAVNQCLEIMGLTQRITPRRHKKFIYQLEVDTLVDRKKKVTIADVGFGYSQLLPIILRGLLSKPGDLVIFEQPEIHLHPSSAANIADLFIAFRQSLRRIIVETHSTEMINRLRLRVLQRKETVDNLNIVFVEPPTLVTGNSEGSSIRQLQLGDDGMFSDWPDGFCDESEKIARDILNARLTRNEDDA